MWQPMRSARGREGGGPPGWPARHPCICWGATGGRRRPGRSPPCRASCRGCTLASHPRRPAAARGRGVWARARHDALWQAHPAAARSRLHLLWQGRCGLVLLRLVSGQLLLLRHPLLLLHAVLLRPREIAGGAAAATAQRAAPWVAVLGGLGPRLLSRAPAAGWRVRRRRRERCRYRCPTEAAALSGGCCCCARRASSRVA
jgi:hypothetical protein